jgi:hypothetical protein
MYSVTLQTSASFETANEAVAHEVLNSMLECLVQMNVAIMRAQRFPPLYTTHVRYRQEPLGQENWRDAAIVLRDGFGDCEDLAAYRVAELRVLHKVHARCVFRWRTFMIDGKTRVKLYHILVGVPHEGKMLIEDPSKRLGMPTHAPERTMTSSLSLG